MVEMVFIFSIGLRYIYDTITIRIKTHDNGNNISVNLKKSINSESSDVESDYAY